MISAPLPVRATACLMLCVTLGVACEAESRPIAPGGNTAPVAAITEPTTGTIVADGTPVRFIGEATDVEDGALTGAALSWSSSRDGALGTGDTIPAATLSHGQHTISLRATDDSGASDAATITLGIGIAPPVVLGLDTVTTGLSTPVFLTAPPGDATRLFVLEKVGRIRVISNGVLLPTPFLDLTSLTTKGGEQGLLGMAFAPDYATSGRFYVSYTTTGGGNAGHSVVARYHVSANPDVAITTDTVIITADQPFANHNGGMIAFGADGMLYFGLGDGGDAGDPLGTGQARTDLLGSMLRLDVSGATYTIPPDNPYAGSLSIREELWNYGLRNPWRWSFDRQTHDLYIADVGQNSWEEVSVQSAASGGGENYGWKLMEGTHCYTSGCSSAGLVQPVLEYGHAEGCSITGGYVYRGAAIPSLQGRYLYSDYCQGWVRSFVHAGGAATDEQDHPTLSPGTGVTSFGEDATGELYIMQGSGLLARIIAH